MLTEFRRPSRVLLTTDAVGGVWTQTLELARGLAGKGIETILAVLGPRASVDQVREAKLNPLLTLQATELPLDWMARSERELEDCAPVLRGLANRIEAEVVHLHAPALAGRRRWHVPLVVSAHSCVGSWWSAVQGGNEPADLAWRTRLTRDGMHTADAVIAPSQSFANVLSNRYDLAIPITVVPNGRSQLLGRRTIRFSQRTGVITAGRLWDGGKNIATLDRAAAAIGATVSAAGPLVGPTGQAYHATNISTLGKLDPMTLARRLGSAAVFASPSVYEPFGISVLEAAQNGAALVLSDIPTFRELWGGAALFHAPRQSDQLAVVASRLLNDSDLRHKMAQLAENRAKRFTVARMVSSTLNIYVDKMARALPRRHPAYAA